MSAIDRILATVCEVYGVSRAELCGRRRFTYLTAPRQMAMYLLRLRLIDMSWVAVATAVGRADHTTAMNAYRKVSAALDHDPHTVIMYSRIVVALDHPPDAIAAIVSDRGYPPTTPAVHATPTASAVANAATVDAPATTPAWDSWWFDFAYGFRPLVAAA